MSRTALPSRSRRPPRQSGGATVFASFATDELEQCDAGVDGRNDWLLQCPAAGSGQVSLTAVYANNAAPVVTAPDQSFAEGASVFYTASWTDTNSNQTHTCTINFGDGTGVQTGTISEVSPNTSGTCSLAHTYADGPATHTITVSVNDGTTSGTDTASASVTNVAPTATFNAPSSVDEGSAISLSLTNPFDPSAPDMVGLQYAFSCGGAYPAYNSISTTTCPATTDDGVVTVKGKIRDKDNGETEYTASVTITNVAPVVTAPANQTANEGQNKSFSLGSFTDPGADSPWSVVVNWGDGSSNTTFSAATAGALAAASHTFADDGIYTVTVTVTEDNGAGASGSATFDVNVSNIAPVVTAAASQTSDEGEDKSFSLGSFTDPGDDDPWSVVVNWGDSSSNTTFTASAVGTIAAANHIYADNGTFTVSVTVTEDNGTGASDSETFQVTVANVAPDVTAPSNQTANEGSSASISLGSFADPGDDDPWSVTVEWGDGSTNTTFNTNATGSLGAHAHTYDDDGPYTVTVTVSEAGNVASDSATFQVTVANVAPTAIFNAPASVNEGSDINLSLTNPSDPSSADTTAGFSYAFDCGSGYGAYSATNTASCSTTDSGSRTVKGKIKDKDDDETEYTETVAIDNVAPTATFTASSPVNEGSAIGLSLTSPFDPSSADTAAGFQYAFDCGSGYGAFSTTSTDSCPTNDNGVRTVKGKIKDKDSGETRYTASVTIDNVAPAPDGHSTFTFNPYTGAAAGSVSFSDPGWGDIVSSSFAWSGTALGGTPGFIGPAASGPGPLTGTFNGSYTLPGTTCNAQPIAVTVSDDEGGSFTHTFAAAGTIGQYTPAFMAPLKDGSRNVVKHGNVIPVKLSIKDCAGSLVSNRTLTLFLFAGVASPDEIVAGTTLIDATSVSSADSGNAMRLADGHYHYNLATKPLTLGFAYTIVIKDGGMVVATAVIDTKK